MNSAIFLIVLLIVIICFNLKGHENFLNIFGGYVEPPYESKDDVEININLPNQYYDDYLYTYPYVYPYPYLYPVSYSYNSLYNRRPFMRKYNQRRLKTHHHR